MSSFPVECRDFFKDSRHFCFHDSLFLRWLIKATGVNRVLLEEVLHQGNLHTESDSYISIATLGLEHSFGNALHSVVVDLRLVKPLEFGWRVGAV